MVMANKAFWIRFYANDTRAVPEAYDRAMHHKRFFCSGERGGALPMVMCCLAHADSEDAATAEVRRCFPEAVIDFCEPRAMDYRPGDRFPGLVPLTAP
jgi:hypothetical protein